MTTLEKINSLEKELAKLKNQLKEEKEEPKTDAPVIEMEAYGNMDSFGGYNWASIGAGYYSNEKLYRLNGIIENLKMLLKSGKKEFTRNELNLPNNWFTKYLCCEKFNKEGVEQHIKNNKIFVETFNKTPSDNIQLNPRTKNTPIPANRMETFEIVVDGKLIIGRRYFYDRNTIGKVYNILLTTYEERYINYEIKELKAKLKNWTDALEITQYKRF